jgi:hypothetical protein
VTAVDLRSAYLQRLTQRFTESRSLLDACDDATAEATAVEAGLNVRDIAGELLHWTIEAERRLPSLLGATALPPVDVSRVLEEVHRQNRRMAFMVLRTRLREAQDRLMVALGGVSVDQFGPDRPVREWLDRYCLEPYARHGGCLRERVGGRPT